LTFKADSLAHTPLRDK